MTRRSSLRPGQVPAAAVQTAIGRYRPQWPAADLKVWDQHLASPLRAWVTYLCPGSESSAYGLMYYGSLFLKWAWAKHHTLDADTVWTMRNVGYWTDTVCKKRPARWRATGHSKLVAIGRVVGPAGGWPPETVPFDRPRSKEPYSRDEELAFLDAAWNGVPLLRPRLLFIVAAGMGAGLDGRWLRNITANDVIDDGPDAASLRVVDTDGVVRIVPVRSLYVPALIEARDTTRHTALIGPSPERANSTNWVAARLVVTGLGKVETQRMRATWLTRLAEAELPVSFIIAASGAGSSTNVLEILRKVSVADPAAAIERARQA